MIFTALVKHSEMQLTQLNQMKMEDMVIDSRAAMQTKTRNFCCSYKFVKYGKKENTLQGLLNDCADLSLAFSLLLGDSLNAAYNEDN